MTNAPATTQEMIQKENEQLKNQNNLLASQLDAHRGLLQEQIQAGLNLRTSIITLQKQIQEYAIQKQALEQQLNSLKEKENAADSLKKQKSV